MRSELGLNDSTIEVMVKMAEGNPGGLNVLTSIMKDNYDNFLMTLLHLDDMNIRGTQIWVGFKDHCKNDIDMFIKCAKDRDEEMIETINKHGMIGNHGYKAVKRGASSPGGRKEFNSIECEEILEKFRNGTLDI